MNYEDIDPEVALTRKITDYEDFVISLMAGKTAEQVDDTELTAEDFEKADHLRRNMRMGDLLDPDVIDRNYLEAVVKGDETVKEYEAEKEYLEKHKKDTPDPPYFPRDIVDTREYDGRDDEFISQIASGQNARLMDSGYMVDGTDEDEDDDFKKDSLGAGEIERYRGLL